MNRTEYPEVQQPVEIFPALAVDEADHFEVTPVEDAPDLTAYQWPDALPLDAVVEAEPAPEVMSEADYAQLVEAITLVIHAQEAHGFEVIA